MKVATLLVYFILVILIFASIGVWLPYGFESLKGVGHDSSSIVQNIVTYFVAILLSSSLDYCLGIMDKTELSSKKLRILSVCLFNVLVLGLTTYILFKNVNGKTSETYFYCIIGIVCASIMWWIANFENPNFKPGASLGGDPNRQLTN